MATLLPMPIPLGRKGTYCGAEVGGIEAGENETGEPQAPQNRRIDPIAFPQVVQGCRTMDGGMVVRRTYDCRSICTCWFGSEGGSWAVGSALLVTEKL